MSTNYNDGSGAEPVVINTGITDEFGFKSQNSPMGELLIAPLYRLIGSVFTGTTLDTNFWTPNLGSGGTVSITVKIR